MSRWIRQERQKPRLPKPKNNPNQGVSKPDAPFSFCFSKKKDYVPFLCPHKKGTKESVIGKALCAALPRVKSALPYVPIPAAPLLARRN